MSVLTAQRRSQVITVLLAAIALTVLGAAVAEAKKARPAKPVVNKERSNAFFEAKFGQVGPGTVTANGHEDDLTSSYAIGASLDFPVIGRFNLGGEISIFDFKYDLPKSVTADASRDLLSAFLVGRYSFFPKEKQYLLRAGAGVGFGYLQEPYQGQSETKYLLWLVSAEGGVMLGKKFGIGVELGLLLGHDSFGTEYEVSTGGMPVLRAMLLSR